MRNTVIAFKGKSAERKGKILITATAILIVAMVISTGMIVIKNTRETVAKYESMQQEMLEIQRKIRIDSVDLDYENTIEYISVEPVYIRNNEVIEAGGLYFVPVALTFENDRNHYKAPEGVKFYSDKGLEEKDEVEQPIFVSPTCRIVINREEGTKSYLYMSEKEILFSDGEYVLEKIY